MRYTLTLGSQFYDHGHSPALELARFTNKIGLHTDMFSTKRSYSVHMSMMEMATLLGEAFTSTLGQQGVYWSPSPSYVYLESEHIMARIHDRREEHQDIALRYDREFSIIIYGPIAYIHEVVAYLDRHYKRNYVAEVSWAFATKEGEDSRTVTLIEPPPTNDAFYPWIKGGIDAYFNAYLRSDETILILLGDTGTGKSSFLRQFLWRNHIKATITYEEELLECDSFYVNFLFDSPADHGALIIEDADTFLLGRQEGNKLMAKFLNAGDGLIKLPNKKLIFTANVVDIGKIDSALLRPGRCFDCRLFRKLTYAEAVVAATAAGLPIPEAEKAYSLAELFAQRKHNSTNYERMVGFTK